ncbi:hypothetical protein OQJ13_05165 [Legionella sp. PATHC035]|uniref:hypothetical protein n=1 Tax=Legionella sp. PATHC035 TaxID=2992040 RepID=UPI002243FC49|nr:hypothetical protein [Legionella sp. PATHC035]MCW8408357.1 hypothetical protein [Legionella sp. PATHC035]
MGDPQDLFQSDFLTIPLDKYQGDHSPVLLKDELSWLIAQLYHFVAESPNSTLLMQSNFSYWITYALQCAVNTYDAEAAQQICTLFYQLSQDSSSLILIFEQTLGGKFAGQTVAYAWMDQLFSATYDPRNTSVVIAINYIFSQLLAQKGDGFSDVVTKNITEGSEKGKNAILVLARALANSAEASENQHTAELIANLLRSFVKKSPFILGISLTEEITHGSFKGKSGVYVLVGAIRQAVEYQPHLIPIVGDILIDVIDVVPNELSKALCKTHEQGPYKGKNTLHIILVSLVSAAYLNKNLESVSVLMHVVHKVWKSNTDGKVTSALLHSIETGEDANINGVMMIVRAMRAAIDHQHQVAPFTDFLIDFIQSDPNELGDAFTHHAPASNLRDYTVSPLVVLINTFQSVNNVTLKTSLRNVINKLADSKSALEMLLSLSGDAKLIFIEELAQVYSLNHKQVTWLAQTDSQQLKASSTTLDSCFFLTKNNWGRGQHFFVTPYVSMDKGKKELQDKEDRCLQDDGRRNANGFSSP